MRVEEGPTAIRVSCSLDTSDPQSQSSFDFVPKPNYNEKWHLENKCLFRNQKKAENHETEIGHARGRSAFKFYLIPCVHQYSLYFFFPSFAFQEGDRCEVECSQAKGHLTRKLCSRSTDKFKLKTDGDGLNQRSGDWRYGDESVENFPPANIAREASNSDWKWKNLYSISDFDRSNQWNHRSTKPRNNVSTNMLRDICNKIDDRYGDSLKCDAKANFLYDFREYLVNYQESCGVPRTEYSFSALIGMMGQATGRSLLALLYVMLNIMPVVEVFLYILRFVLDKVISIRSSKDVQQTAIRCFVFTTELFSVYVCLIFIFGFIVLPIVQMVIGIIGKIMLYN